MDLNTMRQIRLGDGPHRYTPRCFIGCSNTKSHLPRASNVVDPVEYLYVYTSTSQHFTASRTSPNSDRSSTPAGPRPPTSGQYDPGRQQSVALVTRSHLPSGATTIHAVGKLVITDWRLAWLASNRRARNERDQKSMRFWEP